MVFFVKGNLTAVVEWVTTHNSKIEERFSTTEANIEIEDDDEVSFVELCEHSDISCELM